MQALYQTGVFLSDILFNVRYLIHFCFLSDTVASVLINKCEYKFLQLTF